jgi:hypothetical protein
MNFSFIEEYLKVTSLVSYANFARYICMTMRQIHAGCASHPRIRRLCCAHLPRVERATRDVTFGPLYIYEMPQTKQFPMRILKYR